MNPKRTIALKIERLDDTQFAYLLLMIPIVFVLVLDIWPILWTIEMSFHENSQTAAIVGDFVGLETFWRILSGNAFLPTQFFNINDPLSSSLGLTLMIAFATVALSMVLGFGQAMVLNKQFKGRSIARVAFLLPWAIPTAVLGMIFYLLFSPDINVGTSWLEILGFSNHNAPLAYMVEGMSVVIVAETWRQSAFVAIIILAGLQSINRDLYKVSRVNGASMWQQFKLVTFPLILPVIAVALLFRTIAGMRIYGPVVLTTGCDTLPVVVCSVIEQFNAHQYAYASALSTLLAGVIGVILLVYVVFYFLRGGGTGA